MAEYQGRGLRGVQLGALEQGKLVYTDYMSHSLNSLKSSYIGDYIGDYYRAY